MNRTERTPNINKGGYQTLFFIEGTVNMTRENRETIECTLTFAEGKQIIR
jgi:hypothetical protein